MALVIPPATPRWGKPVSRVAGASGYTRPSDWLTLTRPGGGEEKFVGLYGVWNCGANFVALVAQGNYTVDWGDGTAPENYASGVKAEHNYNWSNLPSGTVTSNGFRQAVVTVTPQAGQQLTKIDLQQKHSRTHPVNSHAPMWLDIAMNGPSLSIITIGGSALLLAHLESVYIGTVGTLTTCASMFRNCHKLRQVNTFNTASATTMNYMFGQCYSLVAPPMLNTSSATNMASMFTGCYSLTTVPLFNTAAATAMNNMFSGCYSLTSVPLFNTSLVTNMSNMFSSCNSLPGVPLFNTASVINMSSMFSYCYSLKTIPLFNTSSATNMSYMFYYCYSLISVPALNTASVTTMSNMFYYCYSLSAVPLLNTALVTDMSYMFANCMTLTTVPLLNTAAATSTLYMFANCNSLVTIPLLNMATVTNAAYMFYYCYSLQAVPALNVSSAASGGLDGIFMTCRSLKSAPLSGVARSISFLACMLARDELVAIFNGLGTGTGLTITITDNPGAADLTAEERAIATNKGWSITG